ncbi:MAG: Imm40 family immunity protein [Pseudomonadota bacterium]
MSYSEFNDFLKAYGVPRTDAYGGEVALKKEDAIKAIKLLLGTEVAVLGGDVYELESDGYFRPTYDNWYCNMDECTPSVFAKKSHDIALEYLNKYNENKNLNIRYVLVVDD